MDGIAITTLDNGVRVVTDHMPSVESVSVGVWVRAGARFEAPEVNGVAHLLEHMMFKGTARRSAVEIAQAVENVGGHINAYTAREVTAYYAKVLKNDAALAVDVIADIVRNSVFDEGELGRERSVVLQEIGQAHDTPDDVVFDLFQDVAFPDQPLGRPVLGLPDVVGQMPRDAIVGFHGHHYRGGAMVLAAAGNISHEALCALAEEHLSDVPAGTPDGASPARYAGGERIEARDLEQIHFVMGFQGAPIGSDEYYALSVLSNLFGGGMSSRAVPGNPGAARPRLFHRYLPLRVFRRGCFRHLRRYRSGPDRRIRAGFVWRDRATGRYARRRGNLACAHATQVESSYGDGIDRRAQRTAGQQMLIYDRIVEASELVERIDRVTPEMLSAVARKMFSSTPSLATVGPASDIASIESIRGRLAA